MTHLHVPAEVYSLSRDPFDPVTLVIAKAQAADRAAEDLTEQREQAAQRRQQRPRALHTRTDLDSYSTSRQEAKDARQYAEDWYSALLYWQTREVKIGGSFHYDDSPPPDLLLVGSNKPMPTVYLMTPAGEFDEASVGMLITEMAQHGTVETRQLGKMLDKLRHTPENCLASLLREDGRWSRNRESATRYAVAVMTLAVQLRVEDAEEPLKLMQRELYRLLGA